MLLYSKNPTKKHKSDAVRKVSRELASDRESTGRIGASRGDFDDHLAGEELLAAGRLAPIARKGTDRARSVGVPVGWEAGSAGAGRWGTPSGREGTGTWRFPGRRSVAVRGPGFLSEGEKYFGRHVEDSGAPEGVSEGDIY